MTNVVHDMMQNQLLMCFTGRELAAGSEGFLTGRQWRGLYRQEVVWGEMVRILSNELVYNR